MNRNYISGSNFERRFLAKLKREGRAIKGERFYASKGITDLYWVDKFGSYHEAQLKYSKTKPYIHPKERKRLSEYAERFFPQVTVWLVMKSARKPESMEVVM